MSALAYTLTPTQKRILNILADGRPHARSELIACLHDGAGRHNVTVHLTKLRRLLRSFDHDIVCERAGWGTRYRHVKLLIPAS